MVELVNFGSFLRLRQRPFNLKRSTSFSFAD